MKRNIWKHAAYFNYFPFRYEDNFSGGEEDGMEDFDELGVRQRGVEKDHVI